MLECNKCNTLKPTTEYYYTGLGKRKYHYSCKECCIKRVKDTYHNRRETKFTKTSTEEHKCKRDGIPRIYFMYSKSELIYIGLSTSFSFRLAKHKNQSKFYKYVTSIEVAELKSPIEMALYELLLINHFKPKYNKHTYEGVPPFPLPSLDFKPWPLL